MLAYAGAVAVSVIALAITLAIPIIQRNAPISLFFAAVALAARMGRGPALLCTGLNALLADYFILNPTHHGFTLGLRELVIVAVFLLISGVITSAVESKTDAQREAKQAFDQLSQMIEGSDDAIITSTFDGIFTSWNAAAERMYGYTKQEAIGQHVSLLVPPEVIPEVTDEVERIRRGERVPPHRTRRVSKDGRPLMVSASVSPVYDADGKVSGVLRIVRNVTEQYETELLLQEALSDRERSLALLSSFMNSATIGFSLHDSDTRFLQINDELAALNRMPREAVLGKRVEEALPVVGKIVAENLRHVIETGEVLTVEVEGDVTDPNRERFWLARYFPVRTPSGDLLGVGTAVIDITEQKRAAQRLQVQGELLNLASQPILIRDLEDRITYWNRGAEELYGFKPDEALGQVSHDLLKTDFGPAHDQMISEFQKTGRWQGELIHTTRSGERVNVISRWNRYDGALGPMILEANFDITALRRTERERETILERFIVAQRFGNVGAWEWDIQSGSVWWSDGIRSIHGLAPNIPPTVDAWMAVVRSEDRAGISAALERSLAGLQPYHVDYRIMVDGGQDRWISARGQVVRDHAGRPVKMIGVGVDVTEQRKSEHALRNAEKLAAAGRLAATVAHEINNPLEAATNLLFLAAHDGSLSEQARAYLEIAEQELRRVAHIATQTLGFYRDSSSPSLIRPPEIVGRLLELYARKISARSVEVVRQLDPDAVIMGYAGEFTQVISNLISNALDAMERGGTLAVRTRRVGDRVRITVADTGPGIPPEHLPHIFEPFFTTKKDIGTGLGLWVTRSIIDKHNASIQVRSRFSGARTGTVFVLTFEGGTPGSTASRVSGQ